MTDFPYGRNLATHVGIAVMIDETKVPCEAVGAEPAALSGLSVTWGRTGVLDQPQAATCDFTLADPDGGGDYTSLLHWGASVRVFAVAPNGTRALVFVGRVTDITVTHDARPGIDAEVEVTAVDPSAKSTTQPLRSTAFGGVEGTKVSLPAQTATARRTALMDALGSLGSLSMQSPAMVDGAGASRLGPWEADNPKVWQSFSDLYTGLGFVVWPTGIYYDVIRPPILVPSFDITYATEFYPYNRDLSRTSPREPLAPLTHRDTTAKAPRPAVVLRACDVDLDGTAFAINSGVGGTGQHQFILTFTDANGEDQAVGFSGSRANETTSVPSQVNNVTDARESVDRLGYSVPQTASAAGLAQVWSVDGVTVDPDSVTETDDFDQAMLAMLAMEGRVLRPVVLFELPAWAPWRYRDDTNLPVQDMVTLLNGGTYAYTDGRWVLTLALVAYLPCESNQSSRIVVGPGDTVPAAHDDPRVVASPSTRWDQQAATFTDGVYVWSGSTWDTPLWVRPGDVPPVDSSYWRVIADPTTAWAADAVALFTDGPFGWSGTAWTARAMAPEPWGNYPSMAHDDPRWTSPGSTWPPGYYATFSDGAWRWISGNWRSMTLVAPGDTVTVVPEYSGPVPHTAWDHVYATFDVFGGGARRWDGTAWVRVNVVTPGATNAGGWPSTDPNTVPEPHTAWEPDEGVILADGAYTWNGTGWEPWMTWTLEATNLATNPHAVTAEGWTWSNGFSGQADLTNETGTDTPDGRAGYRRATIVTPDTGGYSGHQYNVAAVGEAGESMVFSAYVRPSVATTYTLNASTRVGSLTGNSGASEATEVPAGQWARLSVTVATTKAYDALRVVLNENAAGPPAGATVDATMVLLERDGELRPYFDGGTPDTDTERHAWTGEADASTSTLTTLGPPPG